MGSDIYYNKATYWTQTEVNDRLRIRGKFVALEGLDGAGITTQTAMLASWLDKQGYDVIPTKEPTNGIWGAVIRSILAGEVETDPFSLCFGFMADRVNHVQKIHNLSHSVDSPVVVSDRYQLSYLAYQHEDTKMDLEWLLHTQEGLPWPDITIFIDVPPVTCIERMRLSRTSQERYETLETLEKIQKGYMAAIKLLLSRGQSIIAVNGTHAINELHKEITSIIRQVLQE